MFCYWHFLITSIFRSLYSLKWCPVFDTFPLIQFSKFNNFLWVCWFLGKKLFDFVPLVWKLNNPYCHNPKTQRKVTKFGGFFTRIFPGNQVATMNLKAVSFINPAKVDLFPTTLNSKYRLNLTLAQITLWPQTFGNWCHGPRDTLAQHDWAHYILDLAHYGSRLFGLWPFGSWHLGPNDTVAYHDLA